MIVLMAGLPGTGKSTLARALAVRLGGVVLDKDAIRASIFPERWIEYSTAQDDFVMELMLRTAEYLLGRDPETIVILDGRPFSRKYQVDRVVAQAEQIGVRWRIVECVCPEKVAMRRLKADRAAARHIARNRNEALYREVKTRFEKIARPKLVVRTSLRLEACVNKAQEYLLRK